MSDDKTLAKNQPILVTGASRGIGRAIAFELAGIGHPISVHYHSNERAADDVLAHIHQAGGQAHKLAFDLRDRAQTAAVLDADLAEYGAYFGVVLNAGITDDQVFPLLSGEAWDNVIHTNLDGFYNVLHPLVMPMVRRRAPGRIVTIASVSGLIGNRGQTNYSAAKAGIIAATKSLALELAKRKITVNCVAPGLIETDMTQDLPQEQLAAIAKTRIPLQRLGTVEEVAKTVAFLCSAGAAYITRQVLVVDGGMA